MIHKKSKQVTIEIIGGLGNQLFAFVAGAFLSDLLGVKLRIFQRPSRPGESIHSSTLNSLEIGHTIATRFEWHERFAIVFRRKLYSLLKILRFRLDWAERVSQIHASDTLGYDAGLINVRPGYFVSGYFQTFVYLQELRSRNALPSLELKNPSLWFLEESEKLAIQNPVVMHVRRGDYLLSQNDFIGALAVGYYVDAVKLLFSQNTYSLEHSPLWIFTDSPDGIFEEFSDALGKNIRVVIPPESADPAESLILMSLASSIVISNSTFSWWAASLGKESKVIAPSKWFKAHPDPEGLLPETWMKAESRWIDK